MKRGDDSPQYDAPSAIRSRYLDISRVPLAVPPRAADAGEGSLWMVELVIVSIEEKRGEGLLQDENRQIHFSKKPRVSAMFF